jgi:hypothetical protein
MLGITTMKLFQEWMNSTPSVETQSLISANRELLIIGMSATGKEIFLFVCVFISSTLNFISFIVSIF